MEEKVCELWQMYRQGASYMRALHLPETVRQNVRFYEGDQWAPPTQATKNMPRPVVNMVKFVCRNKRAKLVLTPVKLLYKCESNPALGERFTRFADFMLREMHMKEMDSRAIKDGLLKGSYCYHFYWDADYLGLSGSRGAVRCELIDPLHVYFANPREPDEQKQAWIMIASRVPVSSVLEMADEDVDRELILPDEDAEGVLEPEGAKLCTLLTRYFRVGDEVYCERAVKGTMVTKAYSLAPVEYVGKGASAVELKHHKATLYPVVFGSYEEREDSIYGISEAESIIPNQRIINHILGMEALAIQNIAWGKYVVRKDALKGQQISNEPGEVLVDYSSEGNGIRKLEQHGMSGLPISFVNNLADLTRSVTGASEVMTGDNFLNLSGAAIAQLQAQANQPIEEQRERFWRVKERQGQVLAQLCKLYYATKEWYDETAGAEPEREVFVADDYLDVDMGVSVQACTGASSSTASDVQLLENLFARGAIDAVTFVKAYPEEALFDKERILRLVGEYTDRLQAPVADSVDKVALPAV